MRSEWKEMSLREAGVSLIDCVHKTPPAAESGYPYIAIPQLKNGRINLTGVRRITQEHFIEWTKKADPQPYDVILSRRCNPGETAFVPAGFKGALGQNLVLLRSDGQTVFPPFLRWLVRSPQWWEQVGTFLNVGAVFDSLKCADIPNFRLAIPPIAEQKAIAHILGTLDDKIELNQQMNRTLEGIARALFKSWFIDFDPVRAKLDGRQPSGMDAETAALFPDAFEDGGAIGPIPKGWQQCNLGDFLNLKRGYDLPKRLREEGNVPIISSSGFSGYHSAPKVKAPGVATGRYGTVGQVFFIEEDFWPLNTTLYVQDFKGNNPKIAYYILEQIDFNVYADKAAVPGVNRNHVHQEKIVAPPRQIQEGFFKLLEPTWQQQTVNEQETETLRDLRDVLLPKLLSGEIRAKVAEQALEEVA